MKRTALKISLASGLLLLSSLTTVFAMEPSYFVLGDSTTSGTTRLPYPNPTNRPYSYTLYATPSSLVGPNGRMELSKDEYEKRKLEYLTKLKTIRDTRKQTIVANITDKMTLVNKRRTDFWKEVLSKLSAVLARAKNKVNELKNGGKDTANIDSAIAAADSAIAAAQAAVDAQAGKAYTINITTESLLKTNVGQAISGEEADLKAVRQSIEAAYKAVSGVIKLLKQLGNP